AVRRSRSESARRERCGQARGARDARVRLSTERSAILDRPQQGGRGDLRHQALWIYRLAHVARPLPVADPDAVTQGAPVSRMELGDVLSAGHRAPWLSPHATARATTG